MTCASLPAMLHEAVRFSSPATCRLNVVLANATLRGRAWYKLLDAPVLTLDVTVWGVLG